MQENIQIKSLIEQVLGRKLDYQPNSIQLLTTPNVAVTDELELIRYYLNNPHLIDDHMIADLVSKQLKQYNIETVRKATGSPSQDWDAYIDKLEQVLTEVKYRKEHNYEINKIMPPYTQLLQLQQECWQLTENWYGKGNNNLSCFYNYYIAMSQVAGVTSFIYQEMGKFISQDRYITILDVKMRRASLQAHEKTEQNFAAQGGSVAKGRRLIDATSIANVFYHKNARQIFSLLYAKQLVTEALHLEDYGQLPYEQRLRIWQLIQKNFPLEDADYENIFYKYVVFINARPGEYFNYLAQDLPEIGQVTQQKFHDIVKIVGLQKNHLVLLGYDMVNDWLDKRVIPLSWQRKYPLVLIDEHNTPITIRAAGCHEQARLVPNELPYAPGHGLSLCGDGVLWDNWQTVIDPNAECDNMARDIEKIFREFKILCPQLRFNNLLPSEKLINVYQNNISYSSIQATQHTHIATGSLEEYRLYALPAKEHYELPMLNTHVEVVQVGNDIDAIFLKFNFNELENEDLIKFLIQLNQELLLHFGGMNNVDAYIHLFPTLKGKFVLIYEMHARVFLVDHDRFLNLANNTITMRKPQYLEPEGENIKLFPNELGEGLEYLRKFFDATCKSGAHKFITEFILRYAKSQQ